MKKGKRKKKKEIIQRKDTRKRDEDRLVGQPGATWTEKPQGEVRTAQKPDDNAKGKVELKNKMRNICKRH